MNKVVIFGLGKMAELAHIYMNKDSQYEIMGFTVDKKYIKGKKRFRGLPVVSFEDIEKQFPPTEYNMFIATGYRNMNKLRKEKYNEAKKKGYQLVSYVCSKSTQWGDLKVGENTFIFENQVFQPGVEIGNNVLIWSGNHFGHDVKIKDNVFIASHVVLSGNVEVDEGSFLAINSTLRDGVKIGKNCLIGAGALISKDTKNNEVYLEEQTKKYPLPTDKFLRMFEISKN